MIIRFAVVLSALMAMLCFPNQGPKNNGSHIVHETRNLANEQAVSNASISDPAVSSLFNSLSSGTVDDLFVDDYYEGVYFSNLRENFGNNVFGSCSYVSVGMLLSFYDSYWDDSFIPEAYDVEPTSVFTTYPSADFSFPSFYAESPGVQFEPASEIGSLSLEEYLLYASGHSDSYFQCKLISLSESYFGEAKFEKGDNPFGMTFADILGFLGYYLYDYRSFSTSQITISFCNEPDSVKAYTISKIKSGTPVILRSESSALGGHSFIAYDYDEDLDEIYVHTGWRDEDSGKALSHVSLSSTGFTSFYDAVSLTPLMPSSLSRNYHSASGGHGSAQDFAFPQDVEIVSGNYRDELPTFKWKSVFKEKWIEARNPYFNLSILNSASFQMFQIDGIAVKERTLSAQQWNAVLDASGNTYYAYVELDSDTHPYWDEYYTKKSFAKPLEYSQIPQIKPNEYGFADAYPSDETTRDAFVSHAASHNFAFETRRYRTGYIHNEYIVMSPIRKGFKEAFIEYRFSYAVTRIDVELARWRKTSHEWLTSSTGEAEVQYYWGNQWVKKLDLLSSSTALPTNRNAHKFYKIEFDNPVCRVRFHAETFSANTNDDNRGRICIGNMAFYPSEYNLPLSGYELNYEGEAWTSHNYNCYAYALNTTDHGFMQFGGSDGDHNGDENYLTKSYLEYMVSLDSMNYNFSFEPIYKTQRCDVGYYKVALVIAPNSDYHWYRQNSDGLWSHKRGGNPSQLDDASGHSIYDPAICNRNYGLGLNYSVFCGYYQVNISNMY